MLLSELSDVNVRHGLCGVSRAPFSLPRGQHGARVFDGGALKLAKHSDPLFAAVVKDLKRRGPLEDTLMVCGTESGLMPAIR